MNSSMEKLTMLRHDIWKPSEIVSPLKTTATKPRPHWPFLYYTENGKLYHNPIKQRSAYEEASDAGEALL